ncbi:MAG: phosphoribosylanthranilate isomerase [Neisseria sp.]|uniref:phosphoribosylanthranilate isomerase n=1 Tax=Neisseria sp. TaxID=192066 RepID=UPI0026DB0D0F|nr:phosphoribosylanthranilate isomerase [Neisseria sp.]MDO4640415.1 phosphoribosylanthranilate isomerase [Neisseria sp.]
MNIRTKICGLTRPEDAVTAAALGADAIGLVFFEGSKRHVDVAQAQAIVRALPPFVSVVALFVNETESAVRRILAQVPVDILQFHGDETAEFCRRFDRPYLKAVRVRSTDDMLAAANHYPDARAVLFDAHIEGEYGGTGHSFDWNMLPSNLTGNWVLSGGLDAENIRRALVITGARAVDVSSGVESAPGIKSAEKMAAFLAAVRQAEAGEA